jgi:hypothetical protein
MRRFRAASSGLDKFFAAQFSVGYITNMSGFDLRQTQVTIDCRLSSASTFTESAAPCSIAKSPMESSRMAVEGRDRSRLRDDIARPLDASAAAAVVVAAGENRAGQRCRDDPCYHVKILLALKRRRIWLTAIQR